MGMAGIFGVRNGNPAKQGLKQSNLKLRHGDKLVRNGNPAKQGLKPLMCISHIFAVVSETEIQQNKD